MDSRDQTQVVSFGSKYLHLLSYLASPLTLFKNICVSVCGCECATECVWKSGKVAWVGSPSTMWVPEIELGMPNGKCLYLLSLLTEPRSHSLTINLDCEIIIVSKSNSLIKGFLVSIHSIQHSAHAFVSLSYEL